MLQEADLGYTQLGLSALNGTTITLVTPHPCAAGLLDHWSSQEGTCHCQNPKEIVPKGSRPANPVSAKVMPNSRQSAVSV